MRDITLKILRHNAFFAHREHGIIAMPGDENKPVRDIAVDKIMSLREPLTAGHTDNFKKQAVRKFKVSSINKNAISHHQLVDSCIEAEPLLHHLTNDELKGVRQKSLFFTQPCHNQDVEP